MAVTAARESRASSTASRCCSAAESALAISTSTDLAMRSASRPGASVQHSRHSKSRHGVWLRKNGWVVSALGRGAVLCFVVLRGHPTVPPCLCGGVWGWGAGLLYCPAAPALFHLCLPRTHLNFKVGTRVILQTVPTAHLERNPSPHRYRWRSPRRRPPRARSSRHRQPLQTAGFAQPGRPKPSAAACAPHLHAFRASSTRRTRESRGVALRVGPGLKWVPSRRLERTSSLKMLHPAILRRHFSSPVVPPTLGDVSWVDSADAKV